MFNMGGSGKTPFVPDPLPPVKALVTVELQANGEMHGGVFSSRIAMREDGFDYLDALKSPSGDVISGWMLIGQSVYLMWGKENVMYRYQVSVQEVLEPIAAMRVTYLAPPKRHNRRKEWRSNTTISGRFRVENPTTSETTPTERANRPMVTISRSISYSSMRFFSPSRLKPGTRILANWNLTDDDGMEAVMRVQFIAGKSVFQGREGFDIVAMWDPPLEDPVKSQWKAFCDDHWYD